MPFVDNAVHLGIIRTTSLRGNTTTNVDENILYSINFNTQYIDEDCIPDLPSGKIFDEQVNGRT
jgi:hypothetical protein